MSNEDDRFAGQKPDEPVVSKQASGPAAGDLPTEESTGQTQLEQLTHVEAAVESTRMDSGPRATDPVPPGDGRRIGKYHVIEKLSEGGQAEVFRVVHPALRKELAIKLCKTQVEISDQDRHEVVAEGRLLAELDHPGLSRIYDVDFDDNRPYLVMEYIRGRNLREMMRSQDFSPDDAVDVVIRVARSVAAAHHAGITHRDLKPENIVIDDAGNPRVIDFGLAILRHGWAGDCEVNPSLSGTVRYMAPEQARCEGSQINARTDVFALGAILFELLTRQPLNAGDGVNGMLRLAREGTFDHSALNRAGISREVRCVCAQATSADPSLRHADAGRFADALSRVASPGIRYRRLLMSMGLAVAGLLVWGAISRFKHAAPEKPVTLRPLQELVQLRFPRVQPLSSVLPVQSGDEIRIQCNIPTGLQPQAFWFDTEGVLATTPMILDAVAPSESNRRKVLARTSNLQIVGPPGTELVIVAGSELGQGQLNENDLQDLLGDTPWPALPDNVMVVMSSGRVEVRMREETATPRGVITAERDQTDEIVRQMEQLRLKLAKLGQAYFAGVAFPHVDGF